jgi:hypothetical protein
MANKQQYAERSRALASTFANLSDDIMSLQNVFFDRGYGSGGADELTNQDVAGAGVTADDVIGMVTFAGALDTFMVANRGYISKMRNDL